MNPKYFGDSYDIVKRFFCAELAALGYSVLARPMFRGEWNGSEQIFLRFIGASESLDLPRGPSRLALFFDPDTGVRHKPGPRHVSLSQLADGAADHSLAFAFDQSFSWAHDSGTAMRQKLLTLQDLACFAMYYDSHARFLFVSKARATLTELRDHLVPLGIPARRFVTIA
jgi:hypothetical protein